jgi:hypothetical protein
VVGPAPDPDPGVPDAPVHGTILPPGPVPIAVLLEVNPAGPIRWEEVTCQVMGVSVTRGASADRGPYTTPEAGSCSLTLVDPDRDLDPLNSSAKYAPAIRVGARIQVRLAHAELFTGRLDSIAHQLQVPEEGEAMGMTVATLVAYDLIAELAQVQLSETSRPQEAAAARIGAILDLAEVPADLRDLGAGGVQLQAGTVSSDAWSEVAKVTQNELGIVAVDGRGRLVFRTRDQAWAPAQPVIHLGCADQGYPLSALTVQTARASVINRVDASRRSGHARVHEDQPSQDRYGLRGHQRHDLELGDDAGVDAWGLFILSRTAEPAQELSGATLEPDRAGASALAAAVDGLARAHVLDQHHGPDLERTVRILGQSWTLTPELVEVALSTGVDAALRPVGRRFRIDTWQEWTTALGWTGAIHEGDDPGPTGTVGWEILGAGAAAVLTPGAGRVVHDVAAHIGGVDWLELTWEALG